MTIFYEFGQYDQYKIRPFIEKSNAKLPPLNVTFIGDFTKTYESDLPWDCFESLDLFSWEKVLREQYHKNDLIENKYTLWVINEIAAFTLTLYDSLTNNDSGCQVEKDP